MDTPLHALAVPDADPATLKRPETAARELADPRAAALPETGVRTHARSGRRGEVPSVIAADQPIQRPLRAKLLVIDV